MAKGKWIGVWGDLGGESLSFQDASPSLLLTLYPHSGASTHFPQCGLLVKESQVSRHFLGAVQREGWEWKSLPALWGRSCPIRLLIHSALPRTSPAQGRDKKQHSVSPHHRQDPPVAHRQSPSMWARTLWSWIWAILPPVWWASPSAQVWL